MQLNEPVASDPMSLQRRKMTANHSSRTSKRAKCSQIKGCSAKIFSGSFFIVLYNCNSQVHMLVQIAFNVYRLGSNGMGIHCEKTSRENEVAEAISEHAGVPSSDQPTSDGTGLHSGNLCLSFARGKENE
eukprot:Gb_14111 [translate_table: standard]